MQDNVRRLLAYSTISQIGYLLMAVAIAIRTDLALLFYLTAYAVTNLGAFAAVAEFPRASRLEDYRGWNEDVFRYDNPMAGKRKITITVDEELVAALDRAGNVSSQLNDAGWELLERRQRGERLDALLDTLDEQDGPLLDDPVEDARLDRLLGGAA